MNIQNIIIGAIALILPVWGLVLLFKIKKWIALAMPIVWVLAVFLLYRNFSIGTEAALGMAPNSPVGILVVLLLIIASIGVPVFLIGFIPFYYWKLK